jgi:hypothetical protein
MLARTVYVALLLALAAPAFAEDAGKTPETGRYAMTQTPEGFMRLDTRTGAVALCTTTGGVASCRSAPDERDALQQEVDRLTRENAALKARLAAAPQGSRGLDLPKEEDMDKALNFAEKFLRRMMRIMREEDPKDKI